MLIFLPLSAFSSSARFCRPPFLYVSCPRFRFPWSFIRKLFKASPPTGTYSYWPKTKFPRLAARRTACSANFPLTLQHSGDSYRWIYVWNKFCKDTKCDCMYICAYVYQRHGECGFWRSVFNASSENLCAILIYLRTYYSHNSAANNVSK